MNRKRLLKVHFVHAKGDFVALTVAKNYLRVVRYSQYV